MQTMLLAPPECHQHITGPVPVIRGGREPPPENVDRLSVLTDPGKFLCTAPVCVTQYLFLYASLVRCIVHIGYGLCIVLCLTQSMQLDHMQRVALPSPVEKFDLL